MGKKYVTFGSILIVVLFFVIFIYNFMWAALVNISPRFVRDHSPFIDPILRTLRYDDIGLGIWDKSVERISTFSSNDIAAQFSDYFREFDRRYTDPVNETWRSEKIYVMWSHVAIRKPDAVSLTFDEAIGNDYVANEYLSSLGYIAGQTGARSLADIYQKLHAIINDRKVRPSGSAALSVYLLDGNDLAECKKYFNDSNMEYREVAIGAYISIGPKVDGVLELLDSIDDHDVEGSEVILNSIDGLRKMSRLDRVAIAEKLENISNKVKTRELKGSLWKAAEIFND